MENKTAALMFQGTGSDVGKSVIVAGLCRLFANKGYAVAPFKPQNMSNNAAVTTDGGEIGRAQALQARACRREPIVDMNPVLLKPQSEVGSQVVVQGKIWGNASGADYQKLKPQLMADVLASYERLKQSCDLVLVEGAGSAAEVNLRAGDIANMGFAIETQTPVVLIGDIDRGGVIASLVGTHALIQPAEQSLVQGYLINKFRGDPRLFDSGLSIIDQKTGWSSYGVIPFFNDAKKLPPEDALGIEDSETGDPSAIKVSVLRLPRIANFDEFDPLKAENDVALGFVQPGEPIPLDSDLVIIPGSKATIADMKALYDSGWEEDLRALVRAGTQVVGICGGFQMLGQSIADPQGIEGAPETMRGLGLLNVETTLTEKKALRLVNGTATIFANTNIQAYEMHVGETKGPDCARPLVMLGDRPDGALSAQYGENVIGTYCHGLLTNDAFRHALLSRVRANRIVGISYDSEVESTLDALADHLAEHTDWQAMLKAANPSGR